MCRAFKNLQVVANSEGQMFFPALCGNAQARPLAFGKLAVFGFLWARLAWEAHAQLLTSSFCYSKETEFI